MRVILDTQPFLWWITDAPELSNNARHVIAEESTQCWLSLASCWEMAIKISLGKLRLTTPLDRLVPEQLALNGMRLLNIEFRHVGKISTLPFHHRDPFDRLLVTQALTDDLTVISCDDIFSRYGVKRIW
jgi:PIN domain nuclease of toxin-antitoxin system